MYLVCLFLSVLQEAAMAKLAASEAATFASHQVIRYTKNFINISFICQDKLFKSPSMFSIEGYPGVRWNGLRYRHACGETLSRRSHHRNLWRYQWDPEISYRKQHSERISAVGRDVHVNSQWQTISDCEYEDLTSEWVDLLTDWCCCAVSYVATRVQ